jgi:membrane-associated PAP2 superfamily phosphatase
VCLRASGLDHAITDPNVDAGAGVFPRRSEEILGLIGHGLARDFATLVWFCLTAAAIASFGIDELRAYRSILWLTVGAMVVGPILVVVLEDFTSFPCPRHLRRYGGLVPGPAGWFVMPVNAGRCFPAGHSAGGFCFVAFISRHWRCDEIA